MNAQQGRLSVVGLGPGADDLVTDQVRAAIAAASDAFGYFPYVARLSGLEHVKLHASDNREELARQTDLFKQALGDFERLIANGQSDDLERLINRASHARANWRSTPGSR